MRNEYYTMYSNSKQVKHMVRLRQVFQVTLALTFVLWFMLLIKYLVSDPCQSRDYRQTLCEKWENEMIGGEMCSALCSHKEAYLYSCVGDTRNQKVFKYDNTIIKINKGNLASEDKKYDEALYDMPKSDTSMEEFKTMLSGQLTAQLGSGDHTDLINKIMATADANQDGRVSLAEAKTIWSLIQHNEFLILLIFQDTDYVPALKGFCGDMYAYEMVEYSYLFNIQKSGIKKLLFPNSYTWGLPEWNQRAKIAVGLLEFTMETFQHGTHGPFYMCGVSELNIGYTGKYDMKVADVSELIPRATLGAYFNDRTCSSSDDCVYSKQCVTHCHVKTKKCSDDVLHPNIQLVCSILKNYLLKDLPTKIKGDFNYLMYRCARLDNKAHNFFLQHSLMVNEMKSLLWNIIEDKIT